MKHGKKYGEAAKLVDRATQYDPAEAIGLVKKTATAKFDETVEVHIRTGCDGRHAEQQIRGAVAMDVTKAINDIKAGKIEYRLDKSNIIHVPVGKASFSEEALAENYKALMDAIMKAKPSALKGQYLKSITLATTMGPGVKVSTAKYC